MLLIVKCIHIIVIISFKTNSTFQNLLSSLLSLIQRNVTWNEILRKILFMNFYASSNTQIKWDTYKYFSNNMNNDNVQKKKKNQKVENLEWILFKGLIFIFFKMGCSVAKRIKIYDILYILLAYFVFSATQMILKYVRKKKESGIFNGKKKLLLWFKNLKIFRN